MKPLIPHFIHEKFEKRTFSGSFEAAILFVDISGFTQLTETLMRHRKDGAEVLSGVLNRVFAPPIAKVYAHGGFITTFAGDAFTAVFPFHSPDGDDGKEISALLHTARFIQNFFQRHKNIRTQYGAFTMEMRIGLAAGPVTWTILNAGSRHGQRCTYHFRGPAIRAAVEAECHGARGSIVADASIWPALQPWAQAKPADADGYLEILSIAPGNVPRAITPRPMPPEALPPFVSSAVLDTLAGESAAEFRQVAAIFIAFDVPPEDDAQWTAFSAAALDLTHEYQGYFNKLDYSDKGDVIVVLFGAPITHENDMTRAADFLLALQDIAAAWPKVHWKAGLTYGTVYAGTIGGEERCEYGAIGDVMNLSCRLMQQAQWEQIWVDEAVAKHLGDAYHLTALGAYTFKGKSSWMLVYQLLDKKMLVETFYSGRMVGRDAELARLSATIQPIFEGRFAGLICIYGEAGIGKTRLIHGLAQQLDLPRRVRWLTCPADALLKQSLNPFKYMLRTYFNPPAESATQDNYARFNLAFDTLLQRLAEQHPQAVNLRTEMARVRSILAALVDVYWPDSLYAQLEPKLRFQNTLTALKTFVQAEAMSGPVILHIEDAQWLDDDSMAFVHSLCQGLATSPVAIVMSGRYQDDGSMHHFELPAHVPQHTLILEMLPPTAIEDIVSQCLQGPVAPDVAALLADKTDGNPFFAEQLALNLREQNALVQRPDRTWVLVQEGTEEVPATLNAVLIARLDRLTVQVRQVVQTAAVLGREFEVQILSEMLRGDPALPDKLHAAEDEMIWSAMNEMRYLFRHALLRDAAYDMQMRTRLRALHQMAAEAVAHVYNDDLGAHFVDLAYHYDRAEMPAQAAMWYRLAGEQSATQFANTKAIAYLTRALELTPENDRQQRYTILTARERVYDLRGEREAQRRDLDRLKALAQDAQQQASVALSESHYADQIGDYTGADEAARQVIVLAQAQQLVELEAAGHLQWGRAFWRQGQYRNAQPHFERALVLSRRIADTRMEADSLRHLGNVILCMGDYDPARAYYEQALPLYRQAHHKQGESSTLNNISIVLLDQGDYAGSLEYGEQALQIKQTIGDRPGMGNAQRTLANSAYHLGDYARSAAYYEQSWQISRETGDLPGQCEDLIGLTQLARQMDDVNAAYAHIQQALTIAEQAGDQHILGYVLLYLGHALTGQNKVEEAEETYRQDVALRRKLQQPHLALEPLAGLAALALKRGNLEQACIHVEEILPHLTAEALAGTREPCNIYLACYYTLEKRGDPRAGDTLQAAYAMLQARAAKISDAAMRRDFLTKAQAHGEVMALWKKYYRESE
ncbi:MAG: tetratricopeptide repeat protein [Anaerolineae bacterium]|nr:tetratricopeptide repeat protein [Anaerolineae bacterium]